jgi:hypothetical protein
MGILLLLVFVCIVITHFLPYSGERMGMRADIIDPLVKKHAAEAYMNKDLFTSDISFTDARRKLTWMDSVSFYDIYKLNIDNQLTISNLEKTLTY